MYYEIVGTNVRLAGTIHSFRECHPPKWFSDAYQWSEQIVIETKVDASVISTFAMSPQSVEGVPNGLLDNAALLWQRAGGAGDFRNQNWKFCCILLPQLLAKIAHPGAERFILQNASADSKPVKFLESMDDQISVLKALPTTEAIVLLRDMVENPIAEADRMIRLYEGWRIGNINVVESAVKRSRKKCPVWAAAMLEQQERNWIPKIKDYLSADTKTLIAVGSLHVVGLVEQGGLKKEVSGIEFRRLPTPV